VSTLVETCGVRVLALEVAPPGATAEELEEQRQHNKIFAFSEVGKGAYVVARYRSVEEVAADVRAKIATHDLDGLGEQALAQLREMTGPDDKPGSLIKQHLVSDIWWQAARDMGSQAIDIAVVTAALIP
jgi:hypothetical protein